MSNHGLSSSGFGRWWFEVRLALILVSLANASPAIAQVSEESLKRKQIMVRLCAPIIEDYMRHLAGLPISMNPVYLEREFSRCAEVIDEYETLR